MNDASHIEGRFHREVVAPAAADLLIVAHDAEFGLPELQAILGDGVA